MKGAAGDLRDPFVTVTFLKLKMKANVQNNDHEGVKGGGKNGRIKQKRVTGRATIENTKITQINGVKEQMYFKGTIEERKNRREE